jgi:DNA-binding PadR family transcriptional regulator
VKLKPISLMVLGMLRLGATSGYAIKKAADASTNSFWPVSLAQVYPELARLEEHGLVTRHEDPQGARARSAYELTDDGEAALVEWLRAPQETQIQFRVEGMLRFFFADALPKSDQVELARAARERVRDYRSHMYDKMPPGALNDLGGHEIRTPGLVGLFGESLLRRGEEWLAQLIAELEVETPTQSSSRPGS